MKLLIFPLGLYVIAYAISLSIAANPPGKTYPPTKWDEGVPANYNHPNFTEARP